MGGLRTVLCEAGRSPIDLDGRALVLPFGGRVLGLYPRPEVNAFWVNPALGAADSARELLGDPGWINLGGERTWISPEVDTHIDDPSRALDTYEVPRSVDPAAYAVTEQDAHGVSLETRMRVLFRRTRSRVDLKLTKTVSLLDAPPVELPDGVDWTGYALRVRLEADALPDGVRPAPWHLIQVPGGGRIVLPVQPRAQPRVIFGDPDYALENHTITAGVPTATAFKLSLRAEHCTGRLLYTRFEAPTPTLVVRTHQVSAADRYSEVPYDDLDDTGYVEQIFVDDDTYGGFGELEFHSPALGRAGATAEEDESRVWAFAGPVDRLRPILDHFIEATS